MKTRPTSHLLSMHGGTMAVALIMTMLAGLFMAGWVSMMSVRSAQARGGEYAAKRRLALENSRALARQYGYTQWLRSASNVANSSSTDLPEDAGCLSSWTGITNSQPFELPTTTAYPATGYYSTVFPFNHTGFRPGASFVSVNRTTRPNSADGKIDSFSTYLFAKSAPPSFGGDCFVVYKKPTTRLTEITLSSNLYIDGRLVIRDPRSLYASTTVDSRVPIRINARAQTLHVQKRDPLNPISGTVTTGVFMAPSNFPAVSSTNGYSNAAGVAAAYEGDLNVINNSSHTANSLYHIQQREVSAGASLLTIVSPTDYGTATDPVQVIQYTSANRRVPPANVKPSGFESFSNDWSIAYIRTGHADLPHIRISPVIDEVVFEGQTTAAAHSAAAGLDPKIILMISDPSRPTDLTDNVVFTYENARPMIIGCKGIPSIPTSVSYWFVGPSVNGVTRAGLNPAENNTDIGWSIHLVAEDRTSTLYRKTPSSVFSISNRIHIKGGIQTNWSVARDRLDFGAHLTMRISPPDQTYKLATLLPREAWLETYFKFES